jgi:tRNA threonylcarbamoyl adenosine modification protein (Sua5/YciO/YrdC/YwlC family)
MATIYEIHPETPQQQRIEHVKQALRSGAVVLYPTDTVYAIGCDLISKSAVERVRQIKRLSNEKPLTFLCESLSNIAEYAHVTDSAYRIMRHLVPGPFTFLLPATKLVPKLVMNPKRKTTGIRVPDCEICLSLLKSLGNPIISTSAHTPTDNGSSPSASKWSQMNRFELFDYFDKQVDVIIDDGQELTHHVSTILDMTGDEPVVIRKGLGWEAIADWATDLEFAQDAELLYR